MITDLGRGEFRQLDSRTSLNHNTVEQEKFREKPNCRTGPSRQLQLWGNHTAFQKEKII